MALETSGNLEEEFEALSYDYEESSNSLESSGFGESNYTLLFFFLLLVIIFNNSGILADSNESLLFFFLLLVIIFSKFY